MITLNPQTEQQQSIKRADESYTDYLKTGEKFTLQQIKQANDLGN
jgi:hypothetical protein